MAVIKIPASVWEPPEGRLETRPWWHRGSELGLETFSRRAGGKLWTILDGGTQIGVRVTSGLIEVSADAKLILTEAQKLVKARAEGVLPGKLGPSLSEVLAAADAVIPMPSLREGQIWWVPAWGDTPTGTRLAEHYAVAQTLHLHTRRTEYSVHVARDQIEMRVDVRWSYLGNNTGFSTKEMTYTLSDCILLHDPLKPQEAPWGRHEIEETAG